MLLIFKVGEKTVQIEKLFSRQYLVALINSILTIFIVTMKIENSNLKMK